MTSKWATRWGLSTIQRHVTSWAIASWIPSKIYPRNPSKVRGSTLPKSPFFFVILHDYEDCLGIRGNNPWLCDCLYIQYTYTCVYIYITQLYLYSYLCLCFYLYLHLYRSIISYLFSYLSTLLTLRVFSFQRRLDRSQMMDLCVSSMMSCCCRVDVTWLASSSARLFGGGKLANNEG